MMVEKIDTNGKKKKIEQRMMPGYIFIQMDPNHKATFSCVKDTPKISTFIGSEPNQEPRPVPDEEIRRLFDRTEAEAQVAKKKVLVAYSKGDRVRVTEGPFSNFIGDVDEVTPDRTKLRLLISVFGRPTPLDIDMSKVEKAKEGE
jgi:transcriptional antiterminator NusG